MTQEEIEKHQQEAEFKAELWADEERQWGLN